MPSHNIEIYQGAATLFFMKNAAVFYIMNLEQEILRLLTLAGEKGLKIEKVARHVFNSCNTMFSPLDYKEVHAFVSQYLIKNAKDPTSIIEKVEGHGMYRLNAKAKLTQQLMLEFAPHEKEDEGDNQDESTNHSDNDLSLSLF